MSGTGTGTVFAGAKHRGMLPAREVKMGEAGPTTLFAGVNKRGMRPAGASLGADPAEITVQTTGNIRSVRIINPRTMEPVRITYNIQRASYLDVATGRWLPAPSWMRGQLHHLI